MTEPSFAHGALDQVTGKVKHVAGKVFKNSGMRVDGIAQHELGKAEIQGAKQQKGQSQSQQELEHEHEQEQQEQHETPGSPSPPPQGGDGDAKAAG
ncbi:hypothetical protein HDU86_007916 [Geranomyces michiganensis]|nr:hypothetical protein HDU86_007916 [Geranomyces michiganensis]